MEPGSLRKGCENKKDGFYIKLANEMFNPDLEYVKARYDGEIFYVDEKFSKIMSMLRKKGILNETIVVFTSDHGESFELREQHQKKIGHSMMYEEVLRVPLMIWVPGFSRQVRVKNLVEGVDIMPTVLEVLGINVPEGLDGESLQVSLNGFNMKTAAYSETFRMGNTQYAIRYGNLKMINRKKGDIFEFYDLDKDPFERKDIFGLNTSRENKVKEMLLSKISGRPYQPDETVIDNKTIKQLRELGYIA